MKPRSLACERNRAPILEHLRVHLPEPATVLEIGAGTGQHAVYFAAGLPWITWIVTDVETNLPGIRAWTDEAALANLRGPLALDVRDADWPVTRADHAFSANTAHIMAWPVVAAMFAGVGRLLGGGGRFVLYGPFNRDGAYTSESNRRFDADLRRRDPGMGVRDDAALDELATRAGLELIVDEPMPANNRLLVWERQ